MTSGVVGDRGRRPARAPKSRICAARIADSAARRASLTALLYLTRLNLERSATNSRQPLMVSRL